MTVVLNKIKEVGMFGKKRIDNIERNYLSRLNTIWEAIIESKERQDGAECTISGNKFDIGKLDEDTEAMATLIDALRAELDDRVECDKCGCLLKKSTAIRGESVIDTRISMFEAVECMRGELDPEDLTGTETIRKRYYCKVHAPKGKK